MTLRLAPLDRSHVVVRVRAPGKVNLSLRVGPVLEDGYHPVSTVYQAVSLYEEVEARPADAITVAATGPGSDLVPLDETNLAVRAARLLAQHAGISDGVELHLTKGVPVAGGMAGGSADAAATLLACDALWHTGLSRVQLSRLAARLGADVPFALLGHTAVGTGRGDVLTPAMVSGEFHWVFGTHHTGLSTAAVYAAYDAAGTAEDVDPAADRELMQALRLGDPAALGRALHNDLQEPALSLAPQLEQTLETARQAGALGVLVSGSGPTVAALARNRQHALAIGAALTVAGVVESVHCAVGSVAGARILSGEAVRAE